uniref:Acyl-CoA thioesterase n=1 Tax=Ascaris lumbricoides TaxID=6252 RepID=A0A0M3IF36_ASCLU
MGNWISLQPISFPKRDEDDRVSWVITEPYANDGATIWGSSAVVFRQSQMLIGSLFGRLLHCDIDNPQLV